MNLIFLKHQFCRSLQTLACTNAAPRSSMSKDQQILRSSEIRASPLSLSCDIHDLRYDFISFKAEKLLSPDAAVTGSVRRRCSVMLRLQYNSRSCSLYLCMYVSLYVSLNVVQQVLWTGRDMVRKGVDG